MTDLLHECFMTDLLQEGCIISSQAGIQRRFLLAKAFPLLLPRHTMWVTGAAFSPDGRLLASISLDGTVILWGIR